MACYVEAETLLYIINIAPKTDNYKNITNYKKYSMGNFKLTTQQIDEQLSHRKEIQRLIKNTNNIIAEFDLAPTLINEYTKQTTYTEQAHKGKKIALAVQILLINSRSILPAKFFTNLKTENTYQEAFKKPYQFLSDDSIQQYEGILKILKFYQQLLDALYSLPDFSDIIMINTKKTKWREAGINEDDLENIFEV